MRKEYNIKQLKIKRHGLLPGIQATKTSESKVRITIALDKDIIDYFKAESKHSGAFPYQTQINQALRKLIEKWQASSDEAIGSLKEELLSDAEFIHQVAKKIEDDSIRK